MLSYIQKNKLKWIFKLIFIVIVIYFYGRYPFYKFFPDILWLWWVWIGGLSLLASIFGFICIQLGKWKRGGEAEQEVEDVSYELPEDFIILRDIVIGKIGNIDEIIVGPTGIWIIEVKSHTGKITFDGKELRRNGELLEKDFLEQVWSQVNAVRNILKRELRKSFFVQPVICFSDAELHFGLKTVRGAYVIGLDWLKKLILEKSVQLNDPGMDEVVKALEKYKE